MTHLTSNPQSKFQVLSSAVAMPGQCVSCGTPSAPFVDFGFSVDFYGAVIFCFPCAQDMGTSVGMIRHETVRDLIDKADKADQLLAIVNTAIDVFRKNIDESVSVLGDNLTTFSYPRSVDMENNNEPEPGTEESESTDSEDDGLIAANGESFSIEKSTGISSDSSSDDIFSGRDSTSKSK